MFLKITEAKIKEDIFVVPQIRYVINDKQFKDPLMGPEKIIWKASNDVLENFLGI